MGFGIMQCWINVPATDWIGDKTRMAYILLIRLRQTSIPPFQHSTIPVFHYSIFGVNLKTQKNLYIISKL